jgi:hypothetical protein
MILDKISAITRLAISMCFMLIVTMMAQAQDTNGTVIPMSSQLNVRAEPSTNAPILVALDRNTPLIVTQRTRDNAWYAVQTVDGVTGWAYAGYIELIGISRDELPIYQLQTATNPTNNNATTTGTVDGGIDDTIEPPSDSAQPVVPASALPSDIGAIATQGRALGNIPSNFAKVGDSITYAEHFLYPLGAGAYDLGVYAHLQGALNFFLGGENSFSRRSLASGNGWTVESVLNPDFANKTYCEATESPLLCEYRTSRPSVALIMLGSNDVAVVPPDVYAHNLGEITRISVENGIIPVLSTIPYRVGYEAQVEAYNQTIRNVAALYNVPIWDYFNTMNALPNAGLSPDGLHPSIPPGGFDAAAVFNTNNLTYGYTARNLLALQILDNLYRQVLAGL